MLINLVMNEYYYAFRYFEEILIKWRPRSSLRTGLLTVLILTAFYSLFTPMPIAELH
jgi:hypothetical protein